MELGTRNVEPGKPARVFRYLSVCSGIESATVAWHPLGWEAVAFSEIEKFPCAVLAHHYPDVPNLGDMTKYEEWKIDESIDALVGGTPCQGFSVAGLREGLDDSRSQLSLVFVEIAAKFRPRWLVWENVPGVLSSAEGADFAAILGALTGREIPVPEGGWQTSGYCEGIPAAYGVAWRVLDAQYFGVAQRRRRVFVIGYLGDWRRAASVLFERESLSGNPPPSREARQKASGTLGSRSKSGGGFSTDFESDGGLITGSLGSRGNRSHTELDGHGAYVSDTVPTLDASYGRLQGCSGQDANHGHSHLISHSLRAQAQHSHRADIDTYIPISPSVTSKWAKGSGGPAGDECQNLVAVPQNESFGKNQEQSGEDRTNGTDISHTLRGEGFDASEDGSGRGTPIVAVDKNPSTEIWRITCGCGHKFTGPLCIPCPSCGEFRPSYTHGDPINVHPIDLRNGLRGDKAPSAGCGLGDEGDPAFSITRNVQAVAFSCKDHGADAGKISPTLRGMGHNRSHANAGGQVAVVFDTTQITSKENYSNPKAGDPCHPLASQAHPPAVEFTLHGSDGTRSTASETEVAGSIRTKPPGAIENSSTTAVLQTSAVRRLTPLECERLQGFPDNYTRVVRGGGRPDACPDGPRYKALGNSKAVPVVGWIGERIAMVDSLMTMRK